MAEVDAGGFVHRRIWWALQLRDVSETLSSPSWSNAVEP
jgi:hypothetical protein